MRTLRIVLALLALSVFAGAAMAVGNAATSGSAMASSAQMASLKMPGMVPSLDKLTARINLMDRIGSEAMDEASVAASNAVKGKAAQMTYGIQKNIVQNMGKMSGAISLPGMGPVTGRLKDMRAIPAPGPMNMPDWTTPGIIFTL